MNNKLEKFNKELVEFYNEIGWNGGILSSIENDRIIIYRSYFGYNYKTNIDLIVWFHSQDKKYEKWFLECSKKIMRKYNITKEQIKFY